MTTEECPVPLGVSQVGVGRCEDFGSSQGDDIIEEVGPCDDASSDLSTLVVPFPEMAPVVFFCLKQTTFPRSWCIRMVSSPYPLFPTQYPGVVTLPVEIGYSTPVLEVQQTKQGLEQVFMFDYGWY